MELLKDITKFIETLGYKFEPDLTLQQRKWHAVKDEDQKIAWSFDAHEMRDKTVVIVFTVYDYRKQKHFTEKFSNRDLTTAELKKITATISAQAERAREEKEEKWEECRLYAIEQWEKATPVETHPYLEKKNVKAVTPLRVRTTEVGFDLLVPTETIDGKFWGYQTIRENGDKQFPIGARLDSVFCRLGTSAETSRYYICEGLATGLTIGEATGWKYPVIVALAANNLPKVASAIRLSDERTAIILCADNDQWKKENGNPGVEYATQAAQTATGAVVAIPDFSGLDTTSHPTDYNDLHFLGGLEAVKAQLNGVEIERPSVVYYLGYYQNKHYVTTTEDPQIQVLRELSVTELQNLRPLAWWEMRYGDEKGNVDWMAAKDDIIRASKARGIFEPNRLRGRGVWLEKNDVVIHKGDQLVFPDERAVDLQDIESENIYDPRRRVDLPEKKSLDKKTYDALCSVVRRFPWEHPHHSELFLGWLFVAPLAGLLPWRPHVAISAPAGTGKTTLIDLVASELLRFSGFIKREGTTEASLRQNLGSDAVPVILDEFDTNSMDVKKIASILSLLRVSSSGGEISRGTVSGKALNFQAKFCALLSGINLPPFVEADRTRITEMELSPHKRTTDWPQLEKDIDAVCNASTAAALFWTQVERAQLIVESAETFRNIIGQKFTSRHGQQYGVMLAGFWHMHPDHNTPITFDQCKAFVEQWSQHEETAKNEKLFDVESDSDECYEHLMSMQVTKDKENNVFTLSMVCDAYSKGNVLDVKNRFLEPLGMRLITGKGLFVPAASPALAKHFEKTVWPNWAKTLKRRAGVTPTTQRAGGILKKGILIPMEVSEDEF